MAGSRTHIKRGAPMAVPCFAAVGRPDARDLAIQAIAAYQGTALLTSVLRDPSLQEHESRRVAAWVDSLS